MPLEGQDRVISEIQKRADEMLTSILLDAGIPPEQFEAALSGQEIPVSELARMMGTAWAAHARVAARTEEWARESDSRERAYNVAYAREYFLAAKANPKATEAAKKNWVISNSTEIGELEANVAEAQYLAAIHKAARKSLEVRCDMLQSLNKLKVAEWNNSGFMEVPPDEDIAGRS